MRYSGKINNINHIVVSDPYYGKDTKYRYEKDKLNLKDWLVDLDIYTIKTFYDDVVFDNVEFSLILKKDKDVCNNGLDNNIHYDESIKVKDYDIGMDTSSMALGINKYAKEIIDSRDDYFPTCAIKTGLDGWFGQVTEGKKNKELQFIRITGEMDKERCDENELLSYLTKQLELDNLQKEPEMYYRNNMEINEGDIVELGNCWLQISPKCNYFIGTTKYTDLYENTYSGKDRLIDMISFYVNEPLKVKIIKCTKKCENTSTYEGEILDDSIINTFKEVVEKQVALGKIKKGKDDYSEVHFSQFNIIKVLEEGNNLENNMEM